MLRIASNKLAGREGVEFVTADILEYMGAPHSPCDRVVSTYVIHHLTENERALLFRRIAEALAPGGLAVFGDLMFENATHRDSFMAALRDSGDIELADEIDDEFFWDLERDSAALEACGFDLTTRRFGELAFGVCAHLSEK